MDRPQGLKKISRIMFYSHDTFGLGHIRRTQKLANACAGPERAILIACASPKASSFGSQPGIEYLNLPGFTKQVTGDYVPRSLPLAVEEFVNLRGSLLLSAARSFDPDILIIDKEPLGVKRELTPTLEYLKFHQKRCHVVCGFRDILDEKEAVLREWARRDTLAALDEYFDSIFVYGEKDLFDYHTEYSLPKSFCDKIQYLGFIPPDENAHSKSAPRIPFDKGAEKGRPLVTLTLGGGGDGMEILEIAKDFLAKNTRLPFNWFILTGPFISPKMLNELNAIAMARPELHVSDFIPDTLSLFQRSDLVICMGGYNTMTELLYLQKFPLILPRVNPRKEQLLRAQSFAKLGLCDYLAPEQLTAESLLQKITERLAKPIQPKTQITLRGLDSFKHAVESLL